MNSITVRQVEWMGVLPKTRRRLALLVHLPRTRLLRELLAEGVFLVTHPSSYWRIARARGRRSDEMRALRRTASTLESLLARHRIKGQVSGRLKLVSSIHRKMVCRDLPQEAILDTQGLRIIVAGERTCYRVLTLVHRHFEPVLGQLDDYIASPKRNGYQSLHTVVRDHSGRSYEIQIRTSLMHRTAVRGAAAHWRYKERSNGNRVADTFW